MNEENRPEERNVSLTTVRPDKTVVMNQLAKDISNIQKSVYKFISSHQGSNSTVLSPSDKDQINLLKQQILLRTEEYLQQLDDHESVTATRLRMFGSEFVFRDNRDEEENLQESQYNNNPQNQEQHQI